MAAQGGRGPGAAALARLVLWMAGLVLLGEVLLYRLPGRDARALFDEHGRLEIAQIALLVLGLLLAATLATARRPTRVLGIAAAGLLLAVLVREHNNLLKDHGFHGLWQALVGAIAAFTLLLLFRARAGLGPAVSALLASPAVGWLAAAVAVFAFGQLLDERALWNLVLGEGHPYMARRVVEESLELAAYYLFDVGLAEAALAARRPPAGGGA